MKTVLEPKYTNLNGFVPIMSNIDSSNSFFPPAPLLTVIKEADKRNEVHLTYRNSTYEDMKLEN